MSISGQSLELQTESALGRFVAIKEYFSSPRFQ